MDILKNIGRAVGHAAESLGEKHRKTAELHRIRTVVRCEERAAEREYLALGRYYYNALRDKGNPVAEPHCEALDQIEKRLDAALAMMQAVSAAGPAEPEEDGMCPRGDEECEEIDLEGIESFDEDPRLEAAPGEGPTKEGPEAPLPFEG